jgi:hypothetical protein
MSGRKTVIGALEDIAQNQDKITIPTPAQIHYDAGRGKPVSGNKR